MPETFGAVTICREEHKTPEPWYWGGHQIYSILEGVWESFCLKRFFPRIYTDCLDYEWLYMTEQLWAEREGIA